MSGFPDLCGVSVGWEVESACGSGSDYPWGSLVFFHFHNTELLVHDSKKKAEF